MKVIKTIEEILEKNTGYIGIAKMNANQKSNHTVRIDIVLKSVKEYHRQFIPKDIEIQRWAAARVNDIDPDKWGYGDLLIEGAEWCKNNYLNIKNKIEKEAVEKPVHCQLCGRDFIKRMPHKCKDGYRKHHFDWKEEKI